MTADHTSTIARGHETQRKSTSNNAKNLTKSADRVPQSRNGSWGPRSPAHPHPPTPCECPLAGAHRVLAKLQPETKLSCNDQGGMARCVYQWRFLSNELRAARTPNIVDLASAHRHRHTCRRLPLRRSPATTCTSPISPSPNTSVVKDVPVFLPSYHLSSALTNIVKQSRAASGFSKMYSTRTSQCEHASALKKKTHQKMDHTPHTTNLTFMLGTKAHAPHE